MNALLPGGTLSLLETVAQARWFVENNPHLPDRGSVLAVTPKAAYACQQLTQPYLKLEDYTQVSQRFYHYTPVLNDYLQFEVWLDEWAQRTIPEFGAAGFRPASAATFFLQLLFAEIWSTSVSLGELLETTKPAQLALWPPDIIDVPWHLQPMVSPLTILAPAIAQQCGVGIVDLAVQAPALKPIARTAATSLNFKQFLQWVKSRLRQNPLLTDLVQLGLSGVWPYLKRSTPTSPHFLFSGYTYDLSSLARELRRQGAKVTILADTLPPIRLTSKVPPIPNHFKTALTAAWERLLQQPDLWAAMERWGVGYTPLWAKPLQFWWHRLVPELWLHYQYIEPLLQRHKFTALVTWDTGGTTLGSAAANAAAINQVPRYVYQHGGSSGSDAKLWPMYLRHSDTFLVYGQGTADELEQSCPTFLSPHAQIEPVGSLRLDMLRQQQQPEKTRRLRAKLQAGDDRPLVMYVPTCFSTYGRAISDLAAYPDISYFELQQAILKLWTETSTVRLLYKEFIVANDPNGAIMRDFVQTHIPHAIVTNQRLTDLMWAVDAIVIDHVLTAVGEVLLTPKPVVVYMPQPNASNPQAKILLRKRVTLAETPAEFATEVRALLQMGQYSELENPDTEFLRTYSTHLDDGRSAERAAALLLR